MTQVSDVAKKIEKYIRSNINKKRENVVESLFTISDLRLQARTYEKPIPIVFGQALLAGNIIWISEIRSKKVNVAGKSLSSILGFDSILNQIGLGKPQKELRYYIDIAIAICKGEVNELIAVFIDGEIIEPADFNFRFYNGGESQPADSVVGEGVCFNNICYAVFENFDITDYGKRIPVFEFLIYRAVTPRVNNLSYKLRHGIKGVNIIPGSGEFVYETRQNALYYNAFLNEAGLVDGEIKFTNTNTNKGKSDALVGLDFLERDLPCLEWACVVVTWFASGTDIKDCIIFPAVESNHKKTGSYPVHWNVAGKTRWQVRQVSARGDGSLNYGGTVCDSSIIGFLKELKARGKKVLLYPMIFVETPQKPWRGRITGEVLYIKSFFTKQEGYNNFILHYANLAKGLCDAFIIGSEMVGITCMSEGVAEFITLASSVKKIMGSNTKITYSADWSEYHSKNGYYNMDALWANENIDFIGIDAYFPLTDTKTKPSPEQIKKGWQSGEGYDYYYENGEQKPYDKPDYAWKNLRWFVSNFHTNPDGKRTLFVPFSKKIWFTEFGFPSVHLCTNQPNVFYDPSSSESYFPKYSNGNPDFISQKQALLATLEFVEENSDIIENAFVWCYDIRPFPYFPNNRKIWSDGDLWQYGHWLNGKLSSNSFDEIVLELCEKCGILAEEVEFENCFDVVEGLVINQDLSVEHYIKMLCDVYFVKMVPHPKGIKFTSILNLPEKEEVKIESPLVTKNKITSRVWEEDALLVFPPSSISFFFIDKTNRYEAGSIKFEEESIFKNNLHVNIPILFSKQRAWEVAKNLIKLNSIKTRSKYFTLGFNYHFLKPSDIVDVEGETFFIEEVKFDESYNIIISAFPLPFFHSITTKDEGTDILEESFFQSPPSLFCFVAPVLFTSEVKDLFGVYIALNNVLSKHKLYLDIMGESVELEIKNPNQIRGRVVYGELNKGMKNYITDASSYIEVYIFNFNKFANPESIFAGFNIAIIGGEICTFTKVFYKGEGLFALRDFARGRYGSLVQGFEKDDFILMSNYINNASLPSIINAGAVRLYKNEEEVLSSNFKVPNEMIMDLKVAGQGFRILKEGVLFYWIFAVNSDFINFEESAYKAKQVMLNINLKDGSVKKLTCLGESVVVLDLPPFYNFEVKF